MAHHLTKTEIEALVQELAAGNVNPSMEDVQVGDVYLNNLTYANGAFSYVYIVRAVDPIGTRFGKPNRVVAVDVYTTNDNFIERTKRWVSTFNTL